MMRIVYHQVDGRFVPADIPERPERHNFKIQTFLLSSCRWADWSGYRTLKECTDQFGEIEESLAKRQRTHSEYRVVED